MAKLIGMKTVITVALTSNTKKLVSYSATHVIDRHQGPEKIKADMHAITGPEGVTHCLRLRILEV
jgi:NADPH:quinone reductase-like Zn-dependent oxidoreductase